MEEFSFETLETEQYPNRPHLRHLLQERLPQLGLDADMYGPYIWGDDDGGDGGGDGTDDKDGDELREIVLEVLKASSETHAEDESGVWEQLLAEIKTAGKLDSDRRREQRERHLRETKTKMEEDLARAKREEAERPDATAAAVAKKSSRVDDEQKRILLQRYGYDEQANDEDRGSGFGANASGAVAASKKQASSSSSAVPGNNRDTAKAAYMEKSREQRNAQKTTKADERKKTKEQKANKQQMKEARRKRATKGERRA